MLLCSSVRWPTDLNYITFHKNMCPCWDKRVGTFDCGQTLKIFHFVNVEPSLENPILTMILVYDRYESSGKRSSFVGVEKP